MKPKTFYILRNTERPSTLPSVLYKIAVGGLPVWVRDSDGMKFDTPERAMKWASWIALNHDNLKGLPSVLCAEEVKEEIPLLRFMNQYDYSGHREFPSKKRLTIASVNKALREWDIDGELVQGSGYLYFSGADFSHCRSTSVAVCWLNDLSLVGWMAEARHILENR